MSLALRRIAPLRRPLIVLSSLSTSALDTGPSWATVTFRWKKLVVVALPPPTLMMNTLLLNTVPTSSSTAPARAAWNSTLLAWAAVTPDSEMLAVTSPGTAGVVTAAMPPVSSGVANLPSHVAPAGQGSHRHELQGVSLTSLVQISQSPAQDGISISAVHGMGTLRQSCWTGMVVIAAWRVGPRGVRRTVAIGAVDVLSTAPVAPASVRTVAAWSPLVVTTPGGAVDARAAIGTPMLRPRGTEAGCITCWLRHRQVASGMDEHRAWDA